MQPSIPDSATELLQAMIGFDSVTPAVSGRSLAEQPLAEWLANVAAAWGLKSAWLPVEGFCPNLLVTTPEKPGKPWLLFDSHLDTVGTDGMTVDPFAGELRDSRLYGRGACDTKGTGAAMLWAARQCLLEESLAANVAILFSTGEEHNQTGARAFVERSLDALQWRPAGVIVGEPTQMQVVAASNGFARWQIVTRGRAAHSSSPELGHNAISDMARAIVAIEDKYIAKLDASHPMTGRSTCSLNKIWGGVQHNIVPDACTLQVDHRLTPGQTAVGVMGAVRGVLDELTATRTGLQYGFRVAESAPPFVAGIDREGVPKPFACHVEKSLQSADVSSTIIGAPYTTNANHYGPAGLECVVLGPGDIAQAHTADEWISVAELDRGVRGYRALMEATLCSHEYS